MCICVLAYVSVSVNAAVRIGMIAFTSLNVYVGMFGQHLFRMDETDDGKLTDDHTSSSRVGGFV